MNVQYGCGTEAPEGWENFDVSLTLRIQKIPLLGKLLTRNHVHFSPDVHYGDIVKGLPVKRGSCDRVYCSHILEHLALNDCRAALRNTFEMLKANGVFRLVVPDFEYAVGEYINDRSGTAILSFFENTWLGQDVRFQGVNGLLIHCFSNSRRHLWMWDYKGLKRELESVGFTQVRRATFNDSTNVQFQAVERKAKWENALGIECVKP